jgi:hypothetical protein
VTLAGYPRTSELPLTTQLSPVFLEINGELNQIVGKNL